MELKWLKVKAFKRFDELSTLNLTGRLVALVGPNEAGKSSIIRAITYLENDKAIPDIESTRGVKPTDILISGVFFLDKEYLEKAELTTPTWLNIKKLNNGPREYELNPKPPSRNTEYRKKIVSKIRRVTSNKKVIKDIENNHAPLFDQLNQLATQIENASEDLPLQLMNLMDQNSMCNGQVKTDTLF